MILLGVIPVSWVLLYFNLDMTQELGVEQNNILFDCPVTNCKFQTSDTRLLPLHLTISHSLIDGDKICELFAKITTDILHNDDSTIWVQISRDDYLSAPPLTVSMPTDVKSAPLIMDDRVASQATTNANKKRSQLIPNSRLPEIYPQ